LLDDEREEALAAAREKGLLVFVISAVSGDGVKLLLHKVYEEVLQMRQLAKEAGKQEV